uniref:Uncharacterized protein n=1 Tax=Neogoniolithon spectabile TaxID=231755 RepID=A0A3G3MGL6_9FLOR|nr:hypothetical protein [Neogoniolithon spectabile]AYR05979.1 hypothetical protein [Neogoniolithon spectabile]
MSRMKINNLLITFCSIKLTVNNKEQEIFTTTQEDTIDIPIKYKKQLETFKNINISIVMILNLIYKELISEGINRKIIYILTDYTSSLTNHTKYSSPTSNYLRRFRYTYQQHYRYSSKTRLRPNCNKYVDQLAVNNLYVIYNTIGKGNSYLLYKYLITTYNTLSNQNQ